ncbi:rho GTPase-activating protein 26-like isoform X6, partial [Biomphalaria pfeifferi]
NSLSKFGKFIETIEEHRDILISSAEDQFVKPLDNFRKENIGAAKEEKKNFDKQTAKFCQSQERYLNMKASKTNESALQEADTQVEFEKKAFYTASMKYVLKLQEVQEKKKFEFVEILLSYMLGWLTFYHQGYVDLEDFRSYDNDLRLLLQKTRENFECTRDEAQSLMGRMLNENKALKPSDQSGTLKGFTRQGYLYLMEKKTLGTTSWTKYYCQYKKDSKEFFMILYNQLGGKLNEPEKYTLEKCVRRASDSIEKRFCFDVTLKDKSGPLTFQALSEDDRRLWLDAMDGKEPTYTMHKIKTEDSNLDDVGFNFIKRSLAAIESRGLQEQGLYRVVGVNSKVNNLIKIALDPKKTEKINFEDPSVWETKTITSAVKTYLRSLPEPLMTFQLHENFIKAAKQESKTLRILDVHKYVHQLPDANFRMLDMLIGHLKRVSEECELNKMTVANLGVCFGPSLMRPEEESMAAIMDIKFCNIVVEILINNYEQIFKSPPDGTDVSESRVIPNTNQPVNKTPVPNNSEPPAKGAPNSGRNVNHSANQPQRLYGNVAPVMPNSSGAVRVKPRPVQIFNSSTGGFDIHSSTSSSTESLNSAKSNLSPRAVSGSTVPSVADVAALRRGSNTKEPPMYTNVNQLASRYNLNLSGNDAPAFGSVKKRSSNDYSGQSSMSTSMQGSLTGSVSSLSSSKPPRRTVRTKYRCVGDNETELSFEANQLIHNVRPSREPGWLEGTLDGKTGIIPENYVEYIDNLDTNH